MTRSRFRSVALLVAGLSAASPLCAQGEAPESHVVNKGETLWSLANKYLGDPFLWPEIYRLNTDKIQDPHWIYPGEALKLPAAGTVAASAQRPATPAATPVMGTPAPVATPPVAAVPAPAVAAAPAPAAAAADTNPAATTVVTSPPPEPRPQQPRGMTVFNPEANRIEHIARASLNLRGAPTAVRLGEFLASPFVWSTGGPSDAGAVEEAAEAASIGMTAANRPMQYLEPVFVRLPKGATASPGDQYLVYRLDSLIEGQGQVLVPTGIMKLIAPDANGRSRAQLVSKFEDVFEGQRLVPLDSLHQTPGVFPKRVEFGLATKVSWLAYNPILPGSGAYMVLSATSKDGLVPGDQVTLLRDRGADAYGADLPPEEVAVAQVTRVTPYGSGAIILRVLQAGVAPGTRARVTAKMP
ncbi:MAG: LysM peptidoglycan-binding domain-containing protein [Gemmatimonadales bacterium]